MMDFLGLRICDLERSLSEVKFFYRFKSLLYDSSLRRSDAEELRIGTLLEMVAGGSNWSASYPVSVISKSRGHEYEMMSSIWNVYLSIDPRYVPMLNENLCDQRRESLRTWLSRKSSILRFSTSFPSYDSLIDPSQPNRHESNPILKRLIGLFSSLPNEVVHNPRLSVQFPLPILLHKKDFESFTTKMVVSMSWWREVSTHMHPIYCGLRARPEGDMSQEHEIRALLEVVHRARELRKVIKDVEGEEPKEVVEVMDNRLKVFAKRKALSVANRRIVEDIAMASAHVAHNIVIYLIELKNGGNVTEKFRLLVERTYMCVRKLEARVINIYKRWYDPNKTEENITGKILELVGRVVTAHAHRKFAFDSATGDQVEIVKESVHRVQKFVYWMMNAVSSACVHFVYSNFNILTKESMVKDTVEALNLYVTWTAMNVHLEAILGHQTWEAIPKQEEVKDAFRLVPSDVIARSLPVVYETMKDCEMHIFTTLLDATPLTTMPKPLIYDDFAFYLKCSKFVHLCSHPLADFGKHTDGRWNTFCRETLVCFERCRPVLEEMMKRADKAVERCEAELATARKERITRRYKSALSKVLAMIKFKQVIPAERVLKEDSPEEIFGNENAPESEENAKSANTSEENLRSD